MHPIIYVTAFSSDFARDGKANAIGMIPVFTLKQLDQAVAIYSNPPRSLAFVTVDGDHVGNYARAKALIQSAIQAGVQRELNKFRSDGNTTNELAQIVGIDPKELMVILREMKKNGDILYLSGVWIWAP